MVEKVIKRDGRVVAFEEKRIENAIRKAFLAVGERREKDVKRLAEEVVKRVDKRFIGKTPHVENIQDIVEEVLMDEGYAKVAKAYILYRRERERIREEKKRILEKSVIDEVDKRFDVNALRVLTSRYLRKDENGNIVETPKEMFIRVAVHVALAEILYDTRVYDREGKQKVSDDTLKDEKKQKNLKIGKYALNRYHIDALKRAYERMRKAGHMKVSWKELLEMIENGYFSKYGEMVDKFYSLMVEKRFLPNTPVLANFGNPLGMGSACFVLDVDDSIESIMDTLKNAAIIFKSGGGVGYNFSKLRPEGDIVKSTHGIASGPVSFMELYDKMTDVIKQGGIRRGANMGILDIDHPEIEKFVKAKEGNKSLRNFNISVLIKPNFWEYYEKNMEYPLINPRTGKVEKKVNARELFKSIAYQAWAYAEPGVIFFDNLNKHNPFLSSLGPITSTNPCGEVPLYPFESCNLGSINLLSFLKGEGKKKDLDWDKLKNDVMLSIRFLDNVVDVNNYPLREIEEATLKTRKVGLGIMGLADVLFELGIAYGSEESLKLMEKLMEFVNYYSKVASVKLARERGKMPFFEKSSYKEGRLPFSGFYDRDRWNMDWDELTKDVKKFGIRNGYTTVIAPTGSISMVAGCSSGIEPVYSLVYEKNVVIGRFYYVNPVFERCMKEEGIYDEQLLRDVHANRGSIQNIRYIRKKFKKVFVTAMDISPEAHVRVLAAFQRWVDGSISKTTNLPESSTVKDVERIYVLAHKLGCKDVTIYRDRSLKKQVYTLPKEMENTMNVEPSLQVAKNIKFCPKCGTELSHSEGCISCPSCGWGLCSFS